MWTIASPLPRTNEVISHKVRVSHNAICKLGTESKSRTPGAATPASDGGPTGARGDLRGRSLPAPRRLPGAPATGSGSEETCSSGSGGRSERTRRTP